MTDEPRELTTDEVRDKFLDQLRAYVDYWEGQAADGRPLRRTLEGLAVSFLCILDGVTNLPAWIVAPIPHYDDREFRRGEGENWYPENGAAEEVVKADIAGGLHDQWYASDRTRAER